MLVSAVMPQALQIVCVYLYLCVCVFMFISNIHTGEGVRVILQSDASLSTQCLNVESFSTPSSCVSSCVLMFGIADYKSYLLRLRIIKELKYI